MSTDINTNNLSFGAAAPATDTTFYPFWEPAFMPGDYTIQVTQKITSSKITGGSESTPSPAEKFTVSGQRFDLDASQIHRAFPAINTTSDYSSVLPHVVFNNHTFAWQRSLVSPPPGTVTPDANGNVASWLTVLLFDQDDDQMTTNDTLAQQALPGTVQDLQTPPSDTISYPAAVFDNMPESATDKIQYIDVPADLFTNIAPTAKDLAWMGHVREVDTEHTVKHDPSSDSNTVQYSTVMGNRLPQAGNKSVACLVSLEGMHDYLPQEDGTPGSAIGSNTIVRLVLLHRWAFTCLSASQDFGSLASALNVGPFQMDTSTLAAGTAKQALDLGYVAANHSLRQGAETVSWYRGPLVPLAPVEPAATGEVYSHSDALLRYDPDLGMFDVSYAAAWQIGQLMALHDRNFSLALYHSKKAFHTALVEAVRNKLNNPDSTFLKLGEEDPLRALAKKVLQPEIFEQLTENIR